MLSYQAIYTLYIKNRLEGHSRGSESILKGDGSISKQLVCQKYIFKIHSERLRKEKWSLTLSLAEARRNDEIISLADSQMLRWIDELNGIENGDEQAKEIRREIRQIKKLPNSIANTQRIRRLYDELDSVQFKPDYMCLIIDSKKDYYRACEGFSINGITYKRLLATTGGLKAGTIVFASERLIDELRRRVDNGRDMNKPLVTAKLEAYKALTCSASNPVSYPKGVIVVNDCETNFKSDVLYLTDEDDGEPVMELKKDYDVTLNTNDGCGMMLPSVAARWSEELGLDYVMSGCCSRNAFEKGMLFTFDFLEFAEQVAGTYIIKDAWGDERDVRDAEVILTTSMLKLWDSYKNWEDYQRNCEENNYTFGITKACPKELESERKSNYQFIQSFSLNDNDIAELVKPTMEEITDVLGGDWRKAVLFLKGFGLNENNIHNINDDFIKAIMIDKRVLDDPYVQDFIYDAIKKRINQAKVGVLNVHGNYSVISCDLYALCQSMFGLEVTGLLKAGEIYNKYWDDCNSKELLCFRAPMTCHNNIRRVSIADRDNVRHWFQHMNTCTVLNTWDTITSALNGADLDGDIVMLTDNQVLLRKHVPLPALMCAQRKAEKSIADEMMCVESNLKSFGNDIGRTTNYITSMFEVRSHFPKGSREYEVLSYRIMCGQLYQQNAIDAAKGIICKPMPKNWFDWYSVNRMECDDKEFYRSIVADRKPYFMRYIYPQLMKKYNTYIKNANSNAMRKFQMTVDELLALPEDDLSEEQRTFLFYLDKRMPVGTGDCVMNKICRIFEKAFDGIARRRKENLEFDYSFMKSGAEYSDRRYKAVAQLHDMYNRQRANYKLTAAYERVNAEDEHFKMIKFANEFRDESLKVCSNMETLCDIALDICYKKNTTKAFVWRICGEQIIDNLLKANSNVISFPTLDDEGDIYYRGNRFKMVSVKLDKEILNECYSE